jgi:hypothetical protein
MNDRANALAKRLRAKALLVIDADAHFACDLATASFMIDDAIAARVTLNGVLAETREAWPCTQQ